MHSGFYQYMYGVITIPTHFQPYGVCRGTYSAGTCSSDQFRAALRTPTNSYVVSFPETQLGTILAAGLDGRLYGRAMLKMI